MPTHRVKVLSSAVGMVLLFSLVAPGVARADQPETWSGFIHLTGTATGNTPGVFDVDTRESSFFFSHVPGVDPEPLVQKSFGWSSSINKQFNFECHEETTIGSGSGVSGEFDALLIETGVNPSGEHTYRLRILTQSTFEATTTIVHPCVPDTIDVTQSLPVYSSTIPTGLGNPLTDCVLEGAVHHVTELPDGTFEEAAEWRLTRDGCVLDAEFDWSMPDRFGLDENGDGLIDYPTPQDISLDLFRVDLNACVSTGQISSFRWDVDGLFHSTSPGCEDFFFLTEGEHEVTLTVEDLAGNTATSKRLIEVQDWLIVSMGDSFASGEGSPELEGTYIVAGKPKFPFVSAIPVVTEQWQDSDCHRSALAGPAQAALAIEREDPQSSVTFVHVACSGAEVSAGLINAYDGAEDDGSESPAQLLQLASLLGDQRDVDALLISIGGNDIGFADIIMDCLNVPSKKNVNPFESCASDKNFLKVADAIDKLSLKTVPKLFGCLQASGSCWDDTRVGLGIPAERIFATAYPDMTQRLADDGLEDCDYLTFTPAEFEWARTRILDPLNVALKLSWNELGAHFMEHTQGLWEQHGICAEARWFRQIVESATIQGIEGTKPAGAFHPNPDGHALGYAPVIVSELRAAGIGVQS